MPSLWSAIREEVVGTVDEFRQKGAIGALRDAALDARDMLTGEYLSGGKPVFVVDRSEAVLRVAGKPVQGAMALLVFSDGSVLQGEVVEVDDVAEPQRASVTIPGAEQLFLVTIVEPNAAPIQEAHEGGHGTRAQGLLERAGLEMSSVQASGAKPWEVNFGPLSFSGKGLDLKPQFKIGAETEAFKAEAGLSDVRNGLKVSAQAQARVQARSKGRSLRELHESVQCDTPGFSQALNKAQQLLGAKDVLAQIAESLGVSEAQLETTFYGEMVSAEDEPMTLHVAAGVGVGFSAEARLGWRDTEGYHMVGIGGQLATGLLLGANIFAGRHASGRSRKLILGISSFTFEYTFPVGGPQNKLESVQDTLAIDSATNAFDLMEYTLPGDLVQQGLNGRQATLAHCHTTDSIDLLGLPHTDQATLAPNSTDESVNTVESVDLLGLGS